MGYINNGDFEVKSLPLVIKKKKPGKLVRAAYIP